MAQHFSTKDFFRQIPNALLARYFLTRALFGDLDLSAMKSRSQTFETLLSVHDDGC
jgi:hypothetical protein